MTDHDTIDPNGQPEFATHLQNEANAEPDAAAPSPAAMQDMQLALVDRIADVDDERRRSSTQLRKALQTHKDEMEQRLVGYRRALIALSALAGLLTAGMIALGLTLSAQRGEVAQQLANDDTLVTSNDETSPQDRHELATQVADIDLRLARLASQVGDVEPATLSDSVEVLTSQIEGVEATLQSLTGLPTGANADDVATIASGTGDGIHTEVGTGVDTQPRETVVPMAKIEPDHQTEANATVAESPMPPSTPDQTSTAERNKPTPDQAPTPSPEQVPDQIGLQAGATDIELEQRRLEAQIAATRNKHIGSRQSGTLPVDQLIDDQLERLEREYQRLARRVDAPAVQPAGADLASDARLALSADAPRGARTSAPNDSNRDDESGGMTTQQTWIALQLIGVRSRDEVRAFIAEHNLPEPLYLRSETYRGRPWYALIRSLHEDMESAMTARDALPEDLARLDLWLRELPAGTSLARIGPDAND